MNLIDTLGEALTFSFIQRALASGVLVALACALLGVYLVLQRLSMIGDGLAHASFASVAVALVLGLSPLLLSVPFAVGASLLILKLTEKTRLYGDMSIGMVSSFGIALGVLLASVGGGFNVDLFSYLFGSILAVGREELFLAAAAAAGVVAFVGLFYRDLFSVAYDADFAKTTGLAATGLQKATIVLASAVVALGIRIAGTMLVSSLFVIPAAAALQLRRGFLPTLIASATFAVLSVIVGVLGAYVVDVPPGAAIIGVNFAFFALAAILGRRRR